MLNDKIVKLLEELSKEMESAGYLFAVATIGAGGQLNYTGNISSADGARLMQSWLEAETDSCADVDSRHAHAVFDLLVN